LKVQKDEEAQGGKPFLLALRSHGVEGRPGTFSVCFGVVSFERTLGLGWPWGLGGVGRRGIGLGGVALGGMGLSGISNYQHVICPNHPAITPAGLNLAITLWHRVPEEPATLLWLFRSQRTQAVMSVSGLEGDD